MNVLQFFLYCGYVFKGLLLFILNGNSNVLGTEVESSFCLGKNLLGRYLFCFLLQQAACFLFHICNKEIINKTTLWDILNQFLV